MSSLQPEKLALLPRIALNNRQLHDFELLTTGGFNPLQGFLNEDDYNNVVENFRLLDGSLWPIPIVLDVSESIITKNNIEISHNVVLTDAYGTMLGLLTVQSVYRPDKEKEAMHVYGTHDVTHPGVKYLFQETGSIYLGGPIQTIAPVQHYDFLDLRKTPEELKKHIQEKRKKENMQSQNVIAFQTRNPIHRAHAELIRRAAQKYDAQILIQPTVGPTKEGDIDAKRRVKSYRALQQHYFPEATLAVVPIAMRMGGPREALWHAIIRKNHGATHFIVGRDHAGPGKDSTGKPFYGPYQSQNFALEHADEIGMTIVPSQELVYVQEDQAFKCLDEVGEGKTVLSISGTQFRNKLASGEEIPSWFSFPEVVEALREKPKNTGVAIFFTGLSGAGKSTIALKLKEKIEYEKQIPMTFLDGDLVRAHLSFGLGFSREDRNRNIERIGFVASEIVKHGGLVICSAIAPYAESRETAKQLVSQYGRFIEVYVKTSLEICKQRDVKGLYKKAELGLLKGMTGIDDPYQEPRSPDIVIETESCTADEAAEIIYRDIFNN